MLGCLQKEVSMRPKTIAGNWKMYKTGDEAASFVATLASLTKDCQERLLLAVPFTAITAAATAAKGTNIVIGAQNMHDASSGAFTGEIAGPMLTAAGARFVILGHSERREIFGEDDVFVGRKVQAALNAKLSVILCVGETLADREAGNTMVKVSEQVKTCLYSIPAASFEHITIAYEPVWAIGTGKVATPAEAQAVHAAIRRIIGSITSPEVADKLCILYGGSVKPENAAALRAEKDIDGFLVGGASLNPETFSSLCQK